MENKRKRGRPKKDNPIKVGTLQKGYCRFTFIAKKETVKKIRMISKKKSLSIKDLIEMAMSDYFKNNIDKIDKQINEHKETKSKYALLRKAAKEY